MATEQINDDNDNLTKRPSPVTNMSLAQTLSIEMSSFATCNIIEGNTHVSDSCNVSDSDNYVCDETELHFAKHRKSLTISSDRSDRSTPSPLFDMTSSNTRRSPIPGSNTNNTGTNTNTGPALAIIRFV